MRKFTLISAAFLLGVALAACNGSTNNILGPGNPLAPGGNQAQVVFVNGSPDAGPVEVTIDNTTEFCGSGQTGTQCAVAYGTVTPTGQVNLSAGSHTLVLHDSNGNALTIPNFSGNFSVNAGSSYSVVLTGEKSPSYQTGSTLAVTVITDEPFSAKPQVNIHQTSPYVQSINGAAGVQFGYYTNNTPATNNLGQPAAFGSATDPQSIPSTAQNVPITFYAMNSSSGITAGPSVADATNCAGNALPCPNTSGHMQLYLIDGPAAATDSTGVPASMNASAKGVFVGAFAP
jgi:hypothetical protein